MSDKKNHVVWIDVFKGIAILLVVIGHLNTGTVIHNFIYGFHLPAFLFISGLLYKKRDSLKTFIKKDLLKPYIMFLFFAIMWLGFNYIYKLAVFRVNGGEAPAKIAAYLADSAVALLLGNCNITGVSFGAVWYLIMLVVVRILYSAVDVIALHFGKKFIKPVICLMFFVLGSVLLNGINNTVFYLSSAFTGIFFYMSGDMFKPFIEKKTCVSLTKSLIMILSAIPLFLLTYFTGISNLGSNTYESPCIFLVTGILGTVFVMGVSLTASKIGIIKKFLSYYGKNSLSVMGWHSEIRICVLFLLSFAGVSNGAVKNGIVIFATLVLMIPLDIITNRLLKVFDR